MSLIKDKFKDEKFFINRNQGKILYTLQSVKNTLEIMRENNYLKKKFPLLDKIYDLSKIELILITYSCCITFYSRMNYNYLTIRFL